MGYIPQPTPEMGPFFVEVRRESFYLYLGYDTPVQVWAYQPVPHSPRKNPTLELRLEDIPKIRAALDLVERVAGGEKGL